MFMNLLLGLSTMIVCLFLQSLLFTIAIRYYLRNDYLLNSPSLLSTLILMKGLMLILVLGNLAQVAVWALLFEVLGEFQAFSVAFYHSAVNFATLGYGDLVMSEKHRLLGPLEAINGVIMIGISTAALMAAFNDAMQKKFDDSGEVNKPTL